MKQTKVKTLQSWSIKRITLFIDKKFINIDAEYSSDEGLIQWDGSTQKDVKALRSLFKKEPGIDQVICDYISDEPLN